ncbi:MAG: transposon-encoded TnpW family protein [Oscillospiraceae bacterium]|nr:transposon-encoded TnpW family protein [Oscillospiraceae bacterium]
MNHLLEFYRKPVRPRFWQMSRKYLSGQKFAIPCYLDMKYEIGKTTYIVSTHFQEQGETDAADKIKRLINQEISG